MNRKGKNIIDNGRKYDENEIKIIITEWGKPERKIGCQIEKLNERIKGMKIEEIMDERRYEKVEDQKYSWMKENMKKIYIACKGRQIF